MVKETCRSLPTREFMATERIRVLSGFLRSNVPAKADRRRSELPRTADRGRPGTDMSWRLT